MARKKKKKLTPKQLKLKKEQDRIFRDKMLTLLFPFILMLINIFLILHYFLLAKYVSLNHYEITGTSQLPWFTDLAIALFWWPVVPTVISLIIVIFKNEKKIIRGSSIICMLLELPFAALTYFGMYYPFFAFLDKIS